MIDFRYHLVSIIAIFLALAIGIIVGVEGLSPKVANQLHNEAQNVVKENRQQAAQIKQLEDQVGADNAFAQASSAYLLSHLLDGQRVVIVSAPAADGTTISGITTAVQQAGGTVTGTVALTPQFFDPGASTEQTLTNLARQVAPVGVTLPGQAPAGAISGQQAAAQVIADALMTKDGVASALTPSQINSVLNGFGGQGFLQVSGPSNSSTLNGQATLAIVVTPATPPSSQLSPDNLGLIDFAQYLQEAGLGSALVGTIAGSVPSNSAIQAVASGNAGISLTTVDFADTEIGQIVVVQALNKMLTSHQKPTSYSLSVGTVPSPAPTPSTSPSSGSTSASRARNRSPA